MARRAQHQDQPKPRVPKAKAIEILDKLLERGVTIKTEGHKSADLTSWTADVPAKFARLFPDDSPECISVGSMYWQPPQVEDCYGLGEGDYVSYPALLAQRWGEFIEGSLAALKAARSTVEDFWPEDSTPVVKAPVPGGREKLLHLLDRFEMVHRQLQRRRKDGGEARATIKIKDEYDVQDLLHALLFSIFDDVRDEEHAPSTGGLNPRIDFFIDEEELVVETKMTRPTLRNKELVDEIASDAHTYSKHPKAKTLIVFVWDPEHHLDNPRGFIKDMSVPRGELKVVVVIKPG